MVSVALCLGVCEEVKVGDLVGVVAGVCGVGVVAEIDGIAWVASWS